MLLPHRFQALSYSWVAQNIYLQSVLEHKVHLYPLQRLRDEVGKDQQVLDKDYQVSKFAKSSKALRIEEVLPVQVDPWVEVTPI